MLYAAPSQKMWTWHRLQNGKIAKNRKNRKKITNLMTSLSDDDVIGGTSNLSEATCQSIIFHIWGRSCLYLIRCGLNNLCKMCAKISCLYLYIYLYIYLSVTKAIAGLHIRALLWFIGIPYKITLGMIRFVMKVCHNVSLTSVLVLS